MAPITRDDATVALKALVTLAIVVGSLHSSGVGEEPTITWARAAAASNCSKLATPRNCSHAAAGPRALRLGNCTAAVALAFVPAPALLRGGEPSGPLGSVQLAGLSSGLCLNAAPRVGERALAGSTVAAPVVPGSTVLEACGEAGAAIWALGSDGGEDGAGPLVHAQSGDCLTHSLGASRLHGATSARSTVLLAPCTGSRDQRWARRDDGRLRTALGDGLDCGRCALAAGRCSSAAAAAA